MKYLNFTNIFLFNFRAKLSKNTNMNNYLINQINNKQLFYSLIYSLGLVKLEILKTYIKSNLANKFIKPSKSSTSILIMFFYIKNMILCL